MMRVVGTWGVLAGDALGHVVSSEPRHSAQTLRRDTDVIENH